MTIFDRLDKLDPGRFITFRSQLHSRRTAAILGSSLGITFFTCFFTGLISHFIQHEPSWFAFPSQPASFYRFTQGLHVAAGLLSIPLLLAKLWVIYPKLLEWPPVAGFSHAVERMSLPPLIGGGLFMLLTGVSNISQWYFFPFFFTNAHYAVAWITIGALVIHMGAKWFIAREAIFHPTADDKHDEPHIEGAITRRGFLTGVFGTGGIITFFTIGQSFSPLGRFALLAPRRPGVGPQHLPVNKTAVSAGVTDAANSEEYRLRVEGNVATPLVLSLGDLRNIPQRHSSLPIACVEGWSATAQWGGIAVRDLLNMAGAPPNRKVRVESIEQHGLYGQSVLNKSHANDHETLLALTIDGEPLHIDHGYPCRLIAPNRPGVMQTKWVQRLVVL